jgi:hypothetical protein
MQVTRTHAKQIPGMGSRTDERIARAVWLLPAFGALMLWATRSHQPNPDTDFGAWTRFVTTDAFFAQHLFGSIVGQVLNLVAVGALVWLLLATGRHATAALWGFVLTVAGSAGLLAGFGLAAFTQPAIGRLAFEQHAVAHRLYDDVYGVAAFATLVAGTVLFSSASVVLARALRAVDEVPRWARLAYGASGPLIGVLGLAIGPLQTVGAVAAIGGGAGVAVALDRRARTHASDGAVEIGALR